jgi:hypothetical protein
MGLLSYLMLGNLIGSNSCTSTSRAFGEGLLSFYFFGRALEVYFCLFLFLSFPVSLALDALQFFCSCVARSQLTPHPDSPNFVGGCPIYPPTTTPPLLLHIYPTIVTSVFSLSYRHCLQGSRVSLLCRKSWSTSLILLNSQEYSTAYIRNNLTDSGRTMGAYVSLY